MQFHCTKKSIKFLFRNFDDTFRAFNNLIKDWNNRQWLIQSPWNSLFAVPYDKLTCCLSVDSAVVVGAVTLRSRPRYPTSSQYASSLDFETGFHTKPVTRCARSGFSLIKATTIWSIYKFLKLKYYIHRMSNKMKITLQFLFSLENSESIIRLVFVSLEIKETISLNILEQHVDM